MSYDLSFHPPAGQPAPGRDAFAAHFAARPHFTFDPDSGQAHYENEITGVYFDFLHQGGSEAGAPAASFTINLVRPHVFALEAAPEIAAFVEAFGLAVKDPQEGGIEGEKFVQAQFLRGWNGANAVAYLEAFADAAREQLDAVPALPIAEIQRTWLWNRSFEQLTHAHPGVHVPNCAYFDDGEGEVATAVMWPLGLPVLLPRASVLLLCKGEDESAEYRQIDWETVEEKLGLEEREQQSTPAPHWVLDGKELAPQLEALFAEGAEATVDLLPLGDIHPEERLVQVIAAKERKEGGKGQKKK